MAGAYYFSITCRCVPLVHGSLSTVMSDVILARVSETLTTEQSLEGLVRQLLEMLEMVSDMESTYLTKVDINARLQHILYARNSKQMQIPEGLSVPGAIRCASAPLTAARSSAMTWQNAGQSARRRKPSALPPT